MYMIIHVLVLLPHVLRSFYCVLDLVNTIHINMTLKKTKECYSFLKNKVLWTDNSEIGSRIFRLKICLNSSMNVRNRNCAMATDFETICFATTSN